MEELLKIRCIVLNKKPIYFNPTNFYTIEKYQNTDTKELFIANGAGIPKTENASCVLTGKWTNHPKYGMQFSVSDFEEIIEDTTSNCYAYLSSGLIKGIGEKTAQKIIDKFGDQAFTVLETNPAKYLEIPGITRKKLDTILESYNETHTMKVITNLMAKYQLTLNKCVKIYQKFKSMSETIIKNDTYRLCEIEGFGFLTVDKIARDQNPEVLKSLRRYRAATQYVLTENESTGSLYMLKNDFYNRLVALFNNGLPNPISSEEILNTVNDVCSDLIKSSYNDKYIGLTTSFNREQETADAIVDLMTTDSVLNYKMNSASMDNALAKVETSILSENQLKAVKMVMANNFSIITGGAGTGKTTVLRTILDIYRNTDILLMAPTGRAAKRMEESTGHSASTIHSALKILTEDTTTSYSVENIDCLSADLIVIDEVSMLDAFIANVLFTHILAGSKVVLIGDVNQLPSVGAGNVLNELINTNVIPVIELTYNFRQSNGSLIADNANKILSGNTDLTFNKDEFFFMDVMGDEEASNILAGLYTRAATKFGISNVALITPFRKNYACGVNSLNKKIQEAINPSDGISLECNSNGEIFRVNDRVMQLKNRPYAMNGDIGTITSIRNSTVDGIISIIITVLFDGMNKTVDYATGSFDELCLAYATTIHKSQGSEYSVVILSMENNNSLMLTRNLFYTAVTRAREKLVIIGQKELLDLATYNVKIAERISFLGHYLQHAVYAN